jgi:hypothetical protein
MISYNSLLKVDSLLFRFGVVVWVSILAGTIIPALVAARHDVFYKRGIEAQVVLRKVPIAADIQNQKDTLNRRLALINVAIGNNLTDAKDPAENKSLFVLRHDIKDELSRLDQRIIVTPFFLNDLMVAWSAMYIALGTVLFVLIPKVDGRHHPMSWRIALAVMAIYPIYQGPVWLRNFVLNNEQRRVYSFANYDICHASFWMQEINTAIWLVLIAILWQRWFQIYKHRNSELARDADATPNLKSITRLSDTFLHWQVTSVILALGFMVFTGVFWDLVIVNGDRRYLIPAVVVHVIWALSWMLSTLPLFVTWQDFSRKKMRAMLSKPQGEVDGKDSATDSEALEKLSPVALWNGFGSALTALLSFVFPIIHALIK